MAAVNPLSIGATPIDANVAHGIGPRDMTAILQTIKAAGAIQGDIRSEVM
jgi:flagellar basal body P-ring protein FlgI